MFASVILPEVVNFGTECLFAKHFSFYGFGFWVYKLMLQTALFSFFGHVAMFIFYVLITYVESLSKLMNSLDLVACLIDKLTGVRFKFLP